MKVSIIIPIKDEPFINTLTNKIHRKLENVPHEIIIVDKSKNPIKIKDAKHIYQKSNGLGNAFLEGLNHASGDIIVLMDGDGSHRPEDLIKLIKAMNDADIAIGSRFIKDGKTKDKTHRRIISWIFRNIASFILNLPIKDSMSGFSCVKKEVYEKVKLNPIGFKINMELVYKAQKMG